MRVFLICGLLVLSLGTSGCGLFSAKPTQTVDDSGELWQVSRLTSKSSPQESMRRATNACRRLQLKPSTGGGGSWFGGDNDAKDWPVKADYFSASSSAQTVAGEKIELLSIWQDSDETQITVRSRLIPVQHMKLIREIQTELDKPTSK